MVAYDVFLADCPARTTLGLVADTWSVVAVVALGRGPARYTELQERIGGISKKMLTGTLGAEMIRRPRPARTGQGRHRW